MSKASDNFLNRAFVDKIFESKPIGVSKLEFVVIR